jgi:hypothetical protein
MLPISFFEYLVLDLKNISLASFPQLNDFKGFEGERVPKSPMSFAIGKFVRHFDCFIDPAGILARPGNFLTVDKSYTTPMVGFQM